MIVSVSLFEAVHYNQSNYIDKNDYFEMVFFLVIEKKHLLLGATAADSNMVLDAVVLK